MGTKNRILETAFKLFLENGFDNVSMTGIKKESNIATGGFYHYFSSKDMLLMEVIDKYIFNFFNRTLERIRNCEGNPKERLEMVLLQIIGYDKTKDEITLLCESCRAIDYRNLHLLYISSIQTNEIISKRYNEFQASIIEFINDLINEGKNRGEIRKDLNSYELSIFIKSVINGTILLWIAVPKLPIRKIIELNINLVWDNIRY